ncbi:MAG: DUF305 domain-containing protein [Candidatus Paceibacterota bacterium]
MNKISTYLAVSLIVISFIVGIGAGYSFTSQYSLSMYDKNSMDLGQADKWVDLRYINAMIAHHNGAILLAKQAEKSQRLEVQNLAKEIQKNEPTAIAELYTWKKSLYGDSKKVSDPVIPNLGSYDDTFDLRFLNALITHHQNGLVMTTDIKTKSSRSEILNNANAVDKFLTESGEILKGWRTTWYNI